jgi:hypothetical protein
MPRGYNGGREPPLLQCQPERAKMTTPRSRRRFRFTLRMLFVVVTVVGVFVGWNLHRVQQRAQALQDVEARGGYYWLATEQQNMEKVAPLVWRILGAESVEEISLPIQRFTTEDRRAMESLFPEAWFNRGYWPEKNQPKFVPARPPKTKIDGLLSADDPP